MPITRNNYTYQFLDGRVWENTRVLKPRFEYPLKSDPSAYIMIETFEILKEEYAPLQPAEQHPTIGNLYWLSDTPLQDVGNGLGRWERTWGTLPGFNENGLKSSYVNEEFEEYNLEVPGITSTQGLYLQNTVNGFSLSGGNHVITTTVAHDVAVGKRVFVWYYTKDPINNFTYYRGQTKLALAGTAGSTLVVSEIKDINTVTPLWFIRAMSNQEPYTRKVISKVISDFWLPGVNIDSYEDIPVIRRVDIIDLTTGNRTQYLSDGVPGTTPSLTQWQEWEDDGVWLPIEDSIIERYLDSIIYQRKTRYVRAII
jgi:hypothetical protein